MHVLRRSRGAFIPPGRSGTRQRVAGSLVALATAAGLLTACGGTTESRPWSGTSTPTPVVRPPSPPAAAPTSTRSQTQTLPQDAGQQRVQLARRLAAGRPRHRPDEHRPAVHRRVRRRPASWPRSRDERAGQAQGAVVQGRDRRRRRGTTSWSSARSGPTRRSLWYRKSFVQKAGLDMSQPVTWDQIIKAAADNGGTVGVQANKYEGYVVWINALVSGAGGSHRRRHRARASTPRSTIDSPGRRRTPRRSSRQLAHSKAAAAGPVGLQRGHRAGSRSRSAAGRVHGELDVHLPQLRRRPSPTSPRTSATPVPRDRRGRAVAPAVRRHRHRREQVLQATRDLALEAVAVHHQPENQGSQRRARPATCRPARPATSTRRCRSCTRASLLDAVPAERQRGGSALGDAVLERHLRRAPEHLAPADRASPRHARSVRRRSSSRSWTGRACCEHRSRNPGRRRTRTQGVAAARATGPAPRTGSA